MVQEGRGALVEHLSSRQEAGERWGRRGGQKAPLQFSVPLLMNYPRNPFPCYHPHPHAGEGGKRSPSAGLGAAPHESVFPFVRTGEEWQTTRDFCSSPCLIKDKNLVFGGR